MAELGINPGFLIAQIVNFLVLLWLLSRVWDRIADTLDERKRRIEAGLDKERRAEEQLKRAQADYDEKIAEAEQVAREKITEAAALAEQEAQSIRAEAEAEAKRIREHALEEAKVERNRVLTDMRSQIASLAIAAANKLVGKAMDEERQRALVEDFFAKVPAEVTGMEGKQVEVTSAVPLTDDEKKKAQEIIGAEDVTFKVDPNILGGLIVQAGDRVVDGSYLGQLRQMGLRLK